ncbi:hypothetical protein B1222_11850 [Paenibacillus larvae subsp. pulvifaciens]|nr:hypothetical protein B1222_11850 [Paenibacillus larvae subsp. pulvifaciens]AQZ46924.1 hypothetical protein B5S25_10285 [Paenibacillus larvae subsp. pulvifaciens]MBH0343041.1 hypothetical protein [Paenibacillus larvae]
MSERLSGKYKLKPGIHFLTRSPGMQISHLFKPFWVKSRWYFHESLIKYKKKPEGFLFKVDF